MNISTLINGSGKVTGDHDAPPFSLAPYDSSVTANNGSVITFTRQGTDFKRGFIVTGQSVIKKENAEEGQSGIGDIQFGELVVVKFSGDTPSPGDQLGAKPDDWTANALYPSCVECVMVIDTDEKLMLGRLHTINDLFVMTETLISQGGFGEANIMWGEPDDLSLITDLTIIAYSPYADFDVDLIGQLNFPNGKPTIHAMECT